MPALTLDQANAQAMEFLRAGKLVEADHLARQVLQHAPGNAAALHCRGMVAQRQGDHAAAASLIRSAIASVPDAALYYNLSLSLTALGDVAAARDALLEAVRLRPDFAEAHANLGVLLSGAGDPAGAEAAVREALRLRPQDPRTHANLGRILRGMDRLDEAEAQFRRAVEIDPNLAPAWSMLGSALRESGRISEAVDAFKRAVQRDPNYREAHSNLCYAMYFDPSATPANILEEHRAWARKFANTAADSSPRQPRPSHARLRIGYVSPYLRTHVVGFFMQPILRHHDRARFDVTCYSDAPLPDAVTDDLRAHCDRWRDTARVTDEALAQTVREDGIDILIDLTLHMRGCRLGAFAFKPAPVQLTHLAYCGTSGLTQMDGCITDRHMIAPGSEAAFSEKLIPLPETYWCYRPPPEAPDVAPPPAERAGHVTFGSLNALSKVNDRVIDLWSQILARTPGSRLIVYAPGADRNPSIAHRFAAHAIPPARLDLIPRQGLRGYLDSYSRIDVALDPFPYGGGTTTLDALWMGVPVVTLAGHLPVGRAGVSILTNLNLPDLITETHDAYVHRAAALASDLPRLASLRASLRNTVASSPLTDAPRYVRNLESAYLSVWERAL